VIEAAFVREELVATAWDAADAVAEDALAIEAAHDDHGTALAAMVKRYGEAGLLRLVTTAEHGGALSQVECVALCLVRERLGHASPLAELAFAMQGLGSFPMTLAGGEAAKTWLPRVVSGEAVAAFALTEANAGTDLGGIEATARREGDEYVLNGTKVFISNAGVADVYCLFAATGPAGERRRLSGFVVPATREGLETVPTKVLGGHPIGEVRLRDVRVPVSHRLGEEGHGMRVALGTLSRFRTTVGAAALGFAQRALDESVAHVKRREQFGAPLAELAQVQARIAEMACELEAARLLVYRAAASIDAGESRAVVAYRGSMAKLVATESAQRIIDHAVQLHGGRGVLADGIVGRLYQDVRALRIYEGTSDVQKVLIARALLK